MTELSDNSLEKVNGGDGNQPIEYVDGLLLKNNTTEHYFKMTYEGGIDIMGISCWKDYDGIPTANTSALLHKVDVKEFYHVISEELLPDWAKNLLFK